MLLLLSLKTAFKLVTDMRIEMVSLPYKFEVVEVKLSMTRFLKHQMISLTVTHCLMESFIKDLQG